MIILKDFFIQGTVESTFNFTKYFFRRLKQWTMDKQQTQTTHSHKQPKAAKT
jgi:hypothetical protein